MRKIFIGADSAGFELKEEIRAYLTGKGYDVTDCGTDSTASCHYPVYASAVCEQVQKAPADTFGILICGTGVGISLAANKVKGIRAAVCSEPYTARLTKQHNNANIIAFGARVVGEAMAEMIVDEYLSASFEGGRHQGRIDMISDIESEQNHV